MKITIQNFGPISHFEYDLDKDIIVTYGDNNIGKSYAMQLVYLLLKNLLTYVSYYVGYYRYGYFQSEPYSEEVSRIVSAFANGTNDKKDITRIINNAILTDLRERFLSSLCASCENTFGNFNKIRKQKPVVEFQLSNYKLSFRMGPNLSSDGTLYHYSTALKRSSSGFHKSRNAHSHLDIFYFDNVQTTTTVVMENIEKEKRSFAEVLSLSIGNVYFLPASRSGIYTGLNSFSSIFAELSKNRAILTRKIEIPGISEPISDYYLHLSSIRGTENSAYSSVFEKIESKILKGTVKFNRARSALVYQPENIGYQFDMTQVSSMVSEISPIVAFMKYVISPITVRMRKTSKPIVFIEEPEAHLHPKNQIKLVEYFCELRKFGIKLVMSSHSNYIFNKLNNQLLEGVITPENYSAILLTVHETGSVSEFMNMDELGVDDTNFMDAAQELYNEREALIDSWNDSTEDGE